jgi:hypothetical protein
MQQEIGHSEVCNSVTNQHPFNASFPGGQSYSDPNVFDTCVGGSEGPAATGEGPCSGVICQNATTQGPDGPVACPTNNAASGALCEFADGYCFQQGTRNGNPYPQIQFESNVGGSSALCDVATGTGCTQPPIGSKFYPFWSMSPTFTALGSFSTRCVGNFGNVLPTTIQTFGKDAQYGTPNVARFAGTSTSAVLPNPQFTGGCRR